MASSNNFKQLLMNFSLTTNVSLMTLADEWTFMFLIAWLITIPTSSTDRQLGRTDLRARKKKFGTEARRSEELQSACGHLDVCPCSRVDCFLHRGLHLVQQRLTDAGCCQKEQFVGLEALLDIAAGIRDAQPEQRVKLYKIYQIRQ